MTIVLAFTKPLMQPSAPTEISSSVSTIPSTKPSTCKDPPKLTSSPSILHPEAIIVFPPFVRVFVLSDLKTPMEPPL